NDDHMGEEEREGLADFRRNAPIGLREALGRQYSEFMAQHPTTEGLATDDRDPQAYVASVEAAAPPKPKDYSLASAASRASDRQVRTRPRTQPLSQLLGRLTAK